MMKRVVLILLSALLLLSVSACNANHTIESQAYPDELGIKNSSLRAADWNRIKGFKSQQKAVTYSDFFLQASQEVYQGCNRVVLRKGKAACGSYVYISIKVRQGLFTVLQEEAFPVLLGAGAFNDAIEEQLIGKEIGDKIRVNVKQSGLYRNISGTAVIEVCSIEELTPKKDNIAVEDYCCSAVVSSRSSMLIEELMALRNEFLDYAFLHASFEIDEEEVSRIGLKLADEVKASASKRGLSTEEYVLEQYGKTLQEFSGDLSAEAVKEIKRALIIGGLASRFSIDSDPAYLALAKAEYLSTVGKELEMDAALDFQFLEKSVLEYFSKPVLPLYYFWIY